MTASTRQLAARMTQPTDALAPRVRWAVVQSVAAGPPVTLTIRLAGSTTDVPGVRRLDGPTLSAGDTVAVLAAGTDLLVLGALA